MTPEDRSPARDVSATSPVLDRRAERPEALVLPGVELARFVVRERLGSGGMGAVYLAHDPTIDRDVAIKLLHPEVAGSDPSRERLLREARALGKISHPNVVSVHEVGTAGGQVFVVMDVVAGGTLADWLAEEKRSPRDVFGVFLKAARGLAAAHAAGVVHRDFKPANVLVGRDGQVRVTDFGLAAEAGARGDAPAGAAAAGGLTQTGAVVGTPRYMAPEQHQGKRAGPAADQFAFAVSFYEALAGRPPFTGSTYDQLRAEVLSGETAPLPGAVPAWLARIVRRGLQRDPERRYPSMDALIAALERGPLVTWRRVGLATTGALAVGAIVVSLSGLRDEQVCRGSEKLLAGVWDPPARQALETAFRAAKVPDGGDLFARVARALDERAGAWVAARTDACEATAVRREQSAALLDARMACLDDRLGEMRALTRLWQSPENVSPRAPAVVLTMRTLDDCAQAASLAAWQQKPPPAIAGEVAALRQRLDDANALFRIGKIKPAQDRMEELVAEARRLGDRRLLLDTLFASTVLQQLHDPAGVERTLRQIVALAADEHDDDMLAHAESVLVDIVGSKLSRPAEALAISPLAAAAVHRAGGRDALLAELMRYVGVVLLRDERNVEARVLLEQAAVHVERAFGRDSFYAGRAHVALVDVLSRLGKLDEARGHAERALAIYDATVGRQGYEAAELENELGGIEWRRGDLEAARRHYQTALASLRRLVGDDSWPVVALTSNLGEVAQARGELDEARRLFETSMELGRRLRPDHALVASVTLRLADVLVTQGALPAARPLLERIHAAFEKGRAPDHPDVADLLTVEAKLQLAEGRPADAIAPLERALVIRVKDGSIDGQLGTAETSFALARALRAAGRQPARALALAASARSAWEATGRARRVAEVDGWSRAAR